MFIRLGVIVAVLLFSSVSRSDVFRGFVHITSERKLFVDYKEAKDGHPTIIFLNGMTHETKDWKDLVAHLQEFDPDLGILLYDMYGMGQTLQAYNHRFNPFLTVFHRERILPHEQASDLEALIRKLRIKNFKLAGLSYGAGIAQEFLYQYGGEYGNPEVILIAPFVQPIESQVELIQSGMNWTRHWFPRTDISQDRLKAAFAKALSYVSPFSSLSQHQLLELSVSVQNMYWGHPFWSSFSAFFLGNYISDDDLYDYFLKLLVYTAYVSVEPSILERPLKVEAVFRLAQGMKSFNGFDYVDSYPDSSVHLVVPEKDEYIAPETFSKYWEALPTRVRASRLYVKDGRHKLPQELPGLMARWILRIVNDEDGKLKKGKTFRSTSLSFSKCEHVLLDSLL